MVWYLVKSAGTTLPVAYTDKLMNSRGKPTTNTPSVWGLGKLKVKLSLHLFLTEHHAMKAYWGVEV
jgi:hypothetical protein